MKLFYSPDYVLAGHSFDTTRKAKWIADSLVARPLTGVELLAPAPVTESELCVVHHPVYVESVRTGMPRELSESQGFTWDEALWRMVCSSNGGAVAAARAALRDGVAGSLSSGLHHARHDRGAGFCTFNGLVLAARAALSAGIASVLVLDLDAHCGGGTQSLVAHDVRVWQTDVSVSAFDSYTPTAQHSLDLLNDARRYLPVITSRLKELEKAGPEFGLCLYNAGVDPFEGSGIGSLAGITSATLRERERLVLDWCQRRKIPLAFVLAGGYVGPALDRALLVELHRATVEEALQIQ